MPKADESPPSPPPRESRVTPDIWSRRVSRRSSSFCRWDLRKAAESFLGFSLLWVEWLRGAGGARCEKTGRRLTTIRFFKGVLTGVTDFGACLDVLVEAVRAVAPDFFTTVGLAGAAFWAAPVFAGEF